MNRVPNPLIDELASDLAPVSPMTHRTGIAVAFAALALSVTGTALVEGIWMAPYAGQASPFFLIVNLAFLLLGLACAGAVLRMASPSVGNSYAGSGWALAMTAILPAATLVALLGRGDALAAIDEAFALHCVTAPLLTSLVTATALVWWLRRGAPVSATRAGFLTGLAAGALGTFSYGLSCSFDTVAHLGLWHMVPVAIAALAGRIVVPYLVRW
ncbi:NrsF family protein [Qipengyuania soli]|uniref:DUF1109 domain-containing protein n=1 Tax=Qipengyuania soli TaxID=2782568 RepID=A0A7S8F4V6_9SPHN|nr:DUF1109 domain-containing protein [Qipengyuania soli]QPC99028.1 DUF1109 domain-containing protein [Qipengyuania soli]